MTFVWIHEVVDNANPILSGTANLAKLTNAKASAPSFCKSSLFEKSGQCLWVKDMDSKKWSAERPTIDGKNEAKRCSVEMPTYPVTSR